ncbi:MAG: SpoIID/LytB protein [Thermoleophilia bacterium]|nr:SpoIID/LytB protein [Thermoleophilia bacterium]
MPHATRTGLAALAAVLLSVLVAAPAASARSSAQYRIEGRGWGHGIGMSQYGAKGYAQKGWSGEQIIGHYFTGTVVAPKPATSPNSLRVLLKPGLDTARVLITSSGTVRQGLVTKPLLPSDVVEFAQVGGIALEARIIRNGETTVLAAGSATDVTITPSLDGSLKTQFRGEFAGPNTAYRGTITGQLVKTSSSATSGRVAVTNTVALESYLRGVVSREMSASWEQQALRAQAIAARSYALYGINPASTRYFDLYSTTMSQVYGGASAEMPQTDEAVASTADQVVRVGDANGKLAQTFFYSTSGGRSANNEDVWTGGTPLRYLRSVVSPFEQESRCTVWIYKSPATQCQMPIYTPAQLAAKLKGSYAGLFKGVDVTLSPSGYASKVNVRGSKGGSTISAGTLQANWGLASTWFRFQLLSINAPNVIKQGQYVTLTGRAPTTGITTLTRTVKGISAKPIAVKVNKTTGLWKAPVKVTGPSVITLTRSGIPGPRLALKPTAPTTTTVMRRTR